MIILRTSYFSYLDSKGMIKKIVEYLDKSGLEDYSIEKKIPLDSISIYPDTNDLKIYIPREFEYSQYDIDDFIRSMVSYARTSTKFERNIYVMKVSVPLKPVQISKLVEYIIEEWDFCTILE